MNKLNKIIYLIIILLVFYFVFSMIKNKMQPKSYIKEYNYFDELEIINIYTNKKPDKIFMDIENIYKENFDINTDNKRDYLNNKIKNFLDNIGIKKYYINMNDTILLSNHEFKVGIPDYKNQLNIIKIINVKNKCISTYMDDSMSITVISNNKCQEIANNLSKLSIEEGLKYVNESNNIEAFWNLNGLYIKSNNFEKYE